MRIYLITNESNGMVYVGQTIMSIEKRWNAHLCDARNGRRRCPRLDDAIRKDSPAVFKIETICLCFSAADLDEKEAYYVKAFDSINPEKGYNTIPGGSMPSWRGKKFSQEHREKIRIAAKKRTHSEETKRKFSEQRKGKPWTAKRIAASK